MPRSSFKNAIKFGNSGKVNVDHNFHSLSKSSTLCIYLPICLSRYLGRFNIVGFHCFLFRSFPFRATESLPSLSPKRPFFSAQAAPSLLTRHVHRGKNAAVPSHFPRHAGCLNVVHFLPPFLTFFLSSHHIPKRSLRIQTASHYHSILHNHFPKNILSPKVFFWSVAHDECR